ncbi:hypothetical protein T01_4373 [Trichinella spiralis]|uniref:Uncharacterized protein n=1 Tax=Trichinella spiralis TaxID=6334 RepID=A0A0V1BLD8_TRISP|nr:hypothetical protein T01_4373 [Trichinella spiralis]
MVSQRQQWSRNRTKRIKPENDESSVVVVTTGPTGPDDRTMNAGVRSTQILNDQVRWKEKKYEKKGGGFSGSEKKTIISATFPPVCPNSIGPLSSSSTREGGSEADKQASKQASRQAGNGAGIWKKRINCWPEEQGRTKRPKIYGEEAAAALKRSRQSLTNKERNALAGYRAQDTNDDDHNQAQSDPCALTAAVVETKVEHGQQRRESAVDYRKIVHVLSEWKMTLSIDINSSDDVEKL